MSSLPWALLALLTLILARRPIGRVALWLRAQWVFAVIRWKLWRVGLSLSKMRKGKINDVADFPPDLRINQRPQGQKEGAK